MLLLLLLLFLENFINMTVSCGSTGTIQKEAQQQQQQQQRRRWIEMLQHWASAGVHQQLQRDRSPAQLQEDTH